MRETSEDIPEVVLGIDVPPTATFDDRIEDGGALACLHITKEEPVLFSDGRGADRVFDEVVVDLNPAIAEIDP
jgi:hypothetical protein